MRRGLRTSIDWALIGAELAQGDDKEQIEFFKTFIKECKSWGTNHQVELQMSYINSGPKRRKRVLVNAFV